MWRWDSRRRQDESEMTELRSAQLRDRQLQILPIPQEGCHSTLVHDRQQVGLIPA